MLKYFPFLYFQGWSAIAVAEVDVSAMETILEAKHQTTSDYSIDFPEIDISVTILWGNIADLSHYSMDVLSLITPLLYSVLRICIILPDADSFIGIAISR